MPQTAEAPSFGGAIIGRTYSHYVKGDKYTVTGVGINANNAAGEDGRREVYYTLVGGGEQFNRSLTEWSEPVEWPDGTVRPRFFPV